MSEQPVPRAQFRLQTLVFGMLVFSIVLASYRRFQGFILRPQAVPAAALLLIIGCIVGRIFGCQHVSRVVIIGVTCAFCVGIVTDRIPNLGDEQTLWSLQALCLGLLCGSLFNQVANENGQPEALN